jgi:periplasmic protein TonB
MPGDAIGFVRAGCRLQMKDKEGATMFEHTLVKRQQSRRRGWTLALAVVLHGATLATVVLASSWSIGEVTPPDEMALFDPPMDVTHLVFEQPQEQAATPPAAPPPADPPAHTEPAPVQPQQQQQETQPETVPEKVADGPSTGEDAPTVPSTAPPSSGPNTGGGGEGDGPTGPGFGPGEGDIAVALDARMTRPETIFRVTPRYTEAARAAHRQGVVIVQATIDRTGHVTDVRLMKGLGLGLDESAISAVKQWRFKPAALAGRPVPVFFQLSVNFNIR